MLKKSISVLLALVMVFGIVVIPASAYAQEAAEGSVADAGLENNDVTVTGANSLGSMLAAEYEENADESEASGSGVYAVEVVGKTARADIRTLVDAQLIISIFDEDGNIMYGSGMTDVTPDDSIVELTLEVDTMPQYFFIRAFLLDKVTNLPLCKQFESDYYTQRMQEFFAKTTDDFDEEKVLNLDEDDTDNFLVYNDDTTVIQNDSSEVNVITYADDDEKKYIIENIDESISQLQPGEIFSCENDDYHIIVKIKTIEINNGIATITGEDIELNDAFDYIKIDASQNSDDAVVDNSNLEEGVEYLGSFVDDDDLAPTGAEIIDEDITASTELSYRIAGGEFAGEHGNFAGTIGLKFDINLRCYYDAHLFKKDEIEFSFKIKYKIGLKAKIEVNGILINIPLGYCGFTPVPGLVYVDFIPSFVVEGKISAEIEGSLKNGQVGITFKNGVWSDETKPSKFTAEAKAEAEVFIGLSMKPHIGILGNVVSATAEAKAGVRVHGELPLISPESESYPDERHNCSKCIKGDISSYCEFSVKLSLVNNDRFTWENKIKHSNKLRDFYYSFDTGIFAFTTCPNKSFKQTVTVLNKKKAPYAGVDVNGVKTSKNGVAVVYLNGGKQTLIFEKDGKKVSKTKTISGAGKLEYTIDFDNPNSFDGMVDHKDGNILDSGQCGDDAYYTLSKDGVLTVTGTGEIRSLAFDGNENIKKAIIEEGITGIGLGAFRYTGITSISIPASVTSIMFEQFQGCESLTEIIIDENNRNYCAVNGVLYNKEKTELLQYPAGKTDKTFSVPNGVLDMGGRVVFYGSDYLTTVNIPASVTHIGWAPFVECSSLTKIVVDDNNSEYSSVEGILYNKDKTELLQYPPGKTDKSFTVPSYVNKIGNQSFERCENLTEVKIPGNVKTIGYESFSQSKSLTSVTISEGVNTIGASAFIECDTLKNVTIPGSVMYIERQTFWGCDSLESVTISYGVERIYQYAFCDCVSLKSITIPGSVRNIGESAFSGCTSLSSVTINDGVDSISDYSFSSCSISSLTIPGSITTIGDRAFNNCSYLKSITIPAAVTDLGVVPFALCSSLTEIVVDENNENYCSVDGVLYTKDETVLLEYPIGNTDYTYTIPDNVTTISKDSFSGSKYLLNLKIPKSVAVIEEGAFRNCTKIQEVFYAGSESEFEAISIDSGNNYLENANFHYNSKFGEKDIAATGADIVTADTSADENEEGTANFSRSHLIPDTEAVLVILEGNENSVEFNSASLLFIAQTTVSENGSVSFDVNNDLGDTWVAYIFAECTHASCLLKTVKEPAEGEEGLKVHICEYCGEVVDSEIIEALPVKYLLGDADGNGRIEVTDATSVQRFIASVETQYTKEELMRGDVDASGDLEITDVTAIQSYLAEISTPYLIGTEVA